MPSNRKAMTVRVVPLGSREAGEARVDGTPAERLRLVCRLSEALWLRTGHVLPVYTRATMPVALGTRHDRA
jgi:hypothetical protein